MFHTTKSSRDYLYFIHSLLEANYALERLTFLGADRDKAQSSFLIPLKGCTFLPCKKHVEDDITRKIADLGLTSIKNEILEDIFGNEVKKEKGIIDSESTDEFMAKVESVSSKWEELEEHLGKEPKFAAYFERHIANDMKNGMLLPVRRRAGLKDDFFYNNVQESSNAVFKNKVKEQKVVEGTGYSPHMKCSWREAMTLYKEYVLQTRRDIQRAVLGKGPYSLSAPYVHLTVTDAQWTGMDRKEREKHLQKLGTSSGECLQEEINEIEPAEERMGSFESSCLPEFARGSWNNANKILELEGIVPFPNDTSKKIVIFLSRPISHTVKISGKKFTCSECPRFTDRGLCAHTLVVASELGNLAEYTKSYRVPLDQLVQSTIPSGTGKKDHEKRKRKRTSKPPREVSTFGDRIEPGPSIEKEEDTPYDVVFIKDTKATTCYGCKGNVRNTAAEPPPPAPYDIFLRHKEFRVYRRRGETKIRISKSLDAVYYHPMRSCAPSASGTNIKMDSSQIQTGGCRGENLELGFNYILFTFLMLNAPCFHFR